MCLLLDCLVDGWSIALYILWSLARHFESGQTQKTHFDLFTTKLQRQYQTMAIGRWAACSVQNWKILHRKRPLRRLINKEEELGVKSEGALVYQNWGQATILLQTHIYHQNFIIHELQIHINLKDSTFVYQWTLHPHTYLHLDGIKEQWLHATFKYCWIFPVLIFEVTR